MHIIYFYIYNFRGLEESKILQLNLLIDYKMSMEITYGAILLELINRIVICSFEVSHGEKI